MKHIITFDHRSDKQEAYDINRFAARAVILNKTELLMVKLSKTNEYKFPGGGIEDDESKIDALIRETKEEVGATIISIESDIGYIDQIYPDRYIKDALFSMRSYYYLTTIDEKLSSPNLSSSEKRLGFKVEWVDIGEAIKVNKQRIKGQTLYHWTERELAMLKYIKNHLIN